MRKFIIISACGLGVACFPYLETYRPDIRGQVLDTTGAQLDGITVKVCSESRWKSMDGCPREATAVSADGGVFRFEKRQEWEWCCLGEAPLPVTRVYAYIGDTLKTDAQITEQWNQSLNFREITIVVK